MSTFVVVFLWNGKQKTEWPTATDSREAIDTICERFGVCYEDIESCKEK